VPFLYKKISFIGSSLNTKIRIILRHDLNVKKSKKGQYNKGNKMKKGFINIAVSLLLALFSSAIYAQSDSYFAMGEDLDFLIESDNTLAIREIEYKLRQFKAYREIEDFVFLLTDEFDQEEKN